MLPDLLGEDNVGKWQSAARQRRAEADVLLDDAQITGAAYLLGYVVECYVKAAFFRVAQFSTADAISREDRARFELLANQLGFMPRSEPHHIPGWAQLLIHIRLEQHRPLSHRRATELQLFVNQAYDAWRPAMRYRMLGLKREDADPLIEAANWCRNSYTSLY